MKFNTVATAASAVFLAGVAHAEEPVEAAVPAPELTNFTVSTALPCLFAAAHGINRY
jgi:hypothetical protein